MFIPGTGGQQWLDLVAHELLDVIEDDLVTHRLIGALVTGQRGQTRQRDMSSVEQTGLDQLVVADIGNELGADLSRAAGDRR